MAKKPKQPEPQKPEGFQDVGEMLNPLEGEVDPITLLQGDNINLHARCEAMEAKVKALSALALEHFGKVI